MTLTNEQRRQQSGRDMEFNRQQSGRNMEESRRASGRKMRDDMRALAENNRLERTLPVLPVRGKQPAKRGSAVWQGGEPSSGGGGIASPLTEQHFITREYWETGIPSSDGLFMFPAPKKVIMTDANDAKVIFEYAEPLIPEPEE